MSRKGAPAFSSLLKDCVLWAPLSGSSINTTGKTITANGNVTQSTAVLDPWGLARPVGYFDGNGDYLTCGAAADWNFLHQVGTTGKWSIRFWYKWYNRTVICRLITTATDASQHGIAIYLTGTREVVGLIEYGVAENPLVQATSTSVPDDSNWHYIVVSYDQSLASANMKIYCDGLLIGSGTKSAQTPSVTVSSNNMTIAARPSTAANPLQGYLSDLCIKNGVVDDGTVPTTRANPDAYTKLLLHMYGSGSTFTDDPFIDVDEFPILPSGVTVTNNGTFTKTDLGNNKSVLNFDGSTNRILIQSHADFQVTNDSMTICLWWRPNSQTGTHQRFVSQFDSDQSPYDFWSFFVYLEEPNSKIYLQRYVDDIQNGSWMTNDYTFNDNTWYYIAVTKTGVSTPTFYVNSIPIVTSVIISQTITDSNFTSSLIIGGLSPSWSLEYTDGNIKDLMIWKGRALTAAEIKLLMNRTHPITGAGLIDSGRYWRLTA